MALILLGAGGYLGYKKFNEGKRKSESESFSFSPPEKPKLPEEKKTETKPILFGRPVFTKNLNPRQEEDYWMHFPLQDLSLKLLNM